MGKENILGHIYLGEDARVVLSDTLPKEQFTKERDRASIMVFDTEGNIGFGKFLTKTQDLVIAGGGVERGESLKQALVREAREELGCNVQNIQSLGMLYQYAWWGGDFERQNYYCFTADIDGDKFDPEFTEREKEVGLSVVWISLDDAQKAFETQREHIQTYTGQLFLKELSQKVTN